MHVLVIGGGIAGISAAHRLAVSGIRVTVLEREAQLAFHTSGRSAQQLVLGYGPEPVQAMTRRTIGLLEDLQQRALDDGSLKAEFMWPASFMLVADGELDPYPGMVLKSSAEVAEIAPELRPGRFTAGGVDTNSRRTDALALIDWLASQAQKAGAEIILDAEVVEITSGTVRLADGREIAGDVVVNAAGAWADEMARLAGARPLGLRPLRRTAAYLRVGQELPLNRNMIVTSDRYYYRPESGDVILASVSESVESEPEDAQPRDADIEQLVADINRDTSLDVQSVERAWTGLRTETPDGIPVVGWDPEVPSFFWLAGQSGYGFQTSAGLAELCCALLQGEDAGWAKEFSPARFDSH